MSNNYVEEIDLEALAHFVDEGLAGLGIYDDTDEILDNYMGEGGVDAVKRAQAHYNNAIAFVNEQLDGDNQFITDEELSDWGFE